MTVIMICSNDNSFVVPLRGTSLPDHQQGEADANNLYALLENEVIPNVL